MNSEYLSDLKNEKLYYKTIDELSILVQTNNQINKKVLN